MFNRTPAGAAKTPYDKTPALLDPGELHLPFDFLKDEYTLLGVSVPDSPHFELMRACAGGDLSGCGYIEKAKKGIIDGRDICFETDKTYLNNFSKNKIKFENGTVRPVAYYTVDGVKYVSDGKHRAAMAAFLKKPLYGYEIPRENLYSSAVAKMLEKMKKHGDIYRKNIEHVEKLKG